MAWTRSAWGAAVLYRAANTGARDLGIDVIGPDADDRFRAVYWDLFALAYRVSLRLLGDNAAAEDTAAEVMARLYSRWGRLQHADYVRAWVARVATNASLDLVRRKRPPIAADPGFNMEEATLDRLALVEALKSLSGRQREVIVLRYIAGIAVDDVAETLGISAGSVRAHLQRGLVHLRRVIGNDPESPLVI
jgi:RNA polymerase sigma factor (sigma-70 family)